jgi:hypothetical protein
MHYYFRRCHPAICSSNVSWSALIMKNSFHAFDEMPDAVTVLRLQSMRLPQPYERCQRSRNVYVMHVQLLLIPDHRPILYFFTCAMKKIRLYGLLLWPVLLSACMTAFKNEKEPLKIERFKVGTEFPSTLQLKEVKMGRMITIDAVDGRIQSAFEKQFINGSNSVWYSLDKSYTQFGVRFRYNNQYAVAVFTRRGYLIYSAVRITESQLSHDYRKLVYANFRKYVIVDITELKIDRRLLWVLELRDASYNTTFIYIEDGVLDILNQYKCKRIKHHKNDTARYVN